MKSQTLTNNKIGYGTWPLSGNISGSKSYGITDNAESIKSLR